MGIFINPFTDWGFKKIFGQEANKDILIGFLNILLEGERVITDVTFLDKEMLGEVKEDRSLIYDIFCETDNGEHIIVEMQNRYQTYFIDRSIYYLSRSIVEQAKKGVWDYHITAVYGVFIMNFEEKNCLEPKLRTDMILADKDTGKMICDKQRYIFLQLPYFNKKESECKSLFDCVIYVLQKMEVLNRMPFEKKNFIFQKLAEIAEVRKLTDEEKIAYDVSLRKYRDTYAVMKTERAEGRAEGCAEGVRSVAVNMKKGGLSVSQIQQFTGLSPEEIEKL